MSVQASGSSTGSATSDSSGHAIITNLIAGTYTVTASYSGATRTNTGVSVTVGMAASTNFDFTPNNPGTGSITVNAQDVNGHAATVQVVLSGLTSGSASTPHTFSSIAYGSYTVTGTSNGETQTGYPSISSSSPTASVALHFSQTISTWPPDILGIIRSFLDNSARCYGRWSFILARCLARATCPRRVSFCRL